MNRRTFLLATGALALPDCGPNHATLLRDVWRPPEVRSTALRSVLDELVRLATLAANSHNSQPWHFRCREGSVEIRPDFARRLPVVDADDHHLWVSLGCAAANIVEAAPAFGLSGEARMREGPDGSHVQVALAPAPDTGERSLEAIVGRQCARSTYDGRPLEATAARILAGTGRESGVDVDLLVTPEHRSALSELIIRGNATQVADTRFRKELESWLRFNASHAAQTRDGLFTGCLGAPTAPAFLARMFFDGSFTVERENERLRAQLDSTPAFAVVTGPEATPAGWVAVGLAVQRLALAATRLDVAHAHVNQPVEVAALRGQLAKLVGHEDRRPDLVLRLGHGPPMPRSLRRPTEDVIERSGG